MDVCVYKVTLQTSLGVYMTEVTGIIFKDGEDNILVTLNGIVEKVDTYEEVFKYYEITAHTQQKLTNIILCFKRLRQLQRNQEDLALEILNEQRDLDIHTSILKEEGRK